MAIWEVLGIRVSADLQAGWCDWLAPRSQPFLVTAGTEPAASKTLNRSDELRDTYLLYGIPSHLRLVWLDESGFRDLPRSERAGLVRQQVVHGRGLVPTVRAWSPVVGDAVREQADGRRFVCGSRRRASAAARAARRRAHPRSVAGGAGSSGADP